MKISWLGPCSYLEGLGLQASMVEDVKKLGGPPRVLGFEHPPTITIGVRGSQERDLLSPLASLKQRGFHIVKCDRGGEATLHNPGQLVIYPIIPIRAYGVGVRDFVRCLQISTQDCLRSYGIPVVDLPSPPGVYTPVGKIGFIGLRIISGVTSHGLALNVLNDLSDFDGIRSCGVRCARHDRLAHWLTGFHDDPHNPHQTKKSLTLEEVFMKWAYCFADNLTRLSARDLSVESVPRESFIS